MEEVMPPGQDVEPGPAPPAPKTDHPQPWAGDGSGMIAAGEAHSVVLDVYSRVFTFGANDDHGQLGRSVVQGEQPPTTPMQILGQPRARCVAARRNTTVIVSENGEVLIFGDLITGRRTGVAVPGFNEVIGVACGENFIVAITTHGTAIGAGMSGDGELGVESFDHVLPRQIPGVRNAIAVAAGGTHCIYLFNDGTIGTMGNNFDGQLGIGTRGDRFRNLVFPELYNVVSICAGGLSTAAVTADGRVATWGYGRARNLGHGDNNENQLIPRFIDGITDGWVVSYGVFHGAIVHRDGTVSTFGRGTSEDADRRRITGWLGQGPDDILVPRKLIGITDAIAVSCGSHHTLIQHVDGSVTTFGAETGGQRIRVNIR
jgi:alpha-tubulin suppressor-like RCC1 family protein